MPQTGVKTPRKYQIFLHSTKHLGVNVHQDAITRWAEHYVKLAEWYAKTLRPPRISDKWEYDKKAAERKRQGVVYSHGDGPYKPVRSGLGYVIHKTKLQCGAAAAGGLRMRRAGFGAYSSFDGLAQFHIAYKRVFYTVKGLMSIHIRDIHIRNLICNTNKQERLNGELAARFAASRGIKKKRTR